MLHPPPAMPLPDFAGTGARPVLRAGDLRSGLFSDSHWSPAAVHSNRLATAGLQALGGGSLGLGLATASGRVAYCMRVELQYTQGSSSTMTENSLGKLLVAPPGKLQPVATARPRAVALARHRCEVQSVDMLTLPDDPGRAIVGSIDAAGNAAISLSELDPVDVDAASEPSSKRRHLFKDAEAAPGGGTVWLQQEVDELGRGAEGWAGLTFAPGATGLGDLSLATAHHWSKRVAFYSSPGGSGSSCPVRTVYAFHHPVDLCYIGGAVDQSKASVAALSTPLLAVAEGHHLSIWDARVAESDGCVRRLCEQHHSSGLLAVAAAGDAVVTAGRDRCVHLYDIRMWRARTRWSHALKYPVTNLQLVASVANGGDDEPASEGGVQRRCYATDSGTELRSAYLDGTRPQLSTGFMGDAPWVGVAAGATHDMPGQGETSSSYVAALTQKGTLYVL